MYRIVDIYRGGICGTWLYRENITLPNPQLCIFLQISKAQRQRD